MTTSISGLRAPVRAGWRAAFHLPCLSIKYSIISYLAGSIRCMMAFAELMDTSCSPLRPP